MDLKGIVDQIGTLSPADFTELPEGDQAKIEPFISGLMPRFSDSARQGLALKTVKGLSANDKETVLKQAVQDLPGEQQVSIAQSILLPPVLDSDRSYLWKLVVWAFSIVLVGSFATLAVGVFLKPDGTVRPELILSLFTSVVGFLAGLFVPSPGQAQRQASAPSRSTARLGHSGH
jgi:hypothetical protein